jgi:diguanylate cyclase (GGDEF)-like protein/PAS domain S-box-containing protein
MIETANLQVEQAASPDTLRGELLRQLGLFHEAAEDEFDELVELASAICGKPLGAMTLLDESTQLLKARVGLQGSRTMPVRESICQYTIRSTGLLMVEDTAADERFADNETLRSGSIRFYAGTPLLATNGCAIGALCVMDTEPSSLTEAQRRALEVLGRQMSTKIQLRERALALAHMAEERDRHRALLHTILDTIPVEIYLKDAHGAILFYNRKLADRFAVSRDEWLGKTSFDLWEQATAEEIAREEAYVLRSGRIHEGLTDIHEASGRDSFWKTIKVPCVNAEGETLLACCAFDITDQMRREADLQRVQDQLEEANRKLNSLALTDSLTGLWNRRAFDSRLETSMMASHRSSQSMALLMLDIDNFKSINDRFGHSYGDTVLRDFASILNRVKRNEDVACRFGGEEFSILLPNADIKGAKSLASRILDALHAYAWEKSPVTASIGVAMCTREASSDELVDGADEALYQAKRSGKDRFVCYNCDIAR